MYYRRKLLLGILKEFGGSLNHTKFQKILFLVTRYQEKKSFDFVPYKFGCFSFQANQDLMTLGKYDLVQSSTTNKSSKWTLKNKADDIYNDLRKEDHLAIKQVKRDISKMNHNDLIRYTYLKYPYYATKSQIAADLLTADELKKVHQQQRKENSPLFFTIGYEGISLETYLNKLIINDIRLLCDVRKNPLSMKYGFSKSQLENACTSINIEYIHLPDLGIVSDKRKHLVSQKDYDKLFDEYDKTTLKENQHSITQLFDLMKKSKRIAITCFEKEPRMCHRSRVLNALINQPQWNFEHKNL